MVLLFVKYGGTDCIFIICKVASTNTVCTGSNVSPMLDKEMNRIMYSSQWHWADSRGKGWSFKTIAYKVNFGFCLILSLCNDTRSILHAVWRKGHKKANCILQDEGNLMVKAQV